MGVTHSSHDEEKVDYQKPLVSRNSKKTLISIIYFFYITFSFILESVPCIPWASHLRLIAVTISFKARSFLIHTVDKKKSVDQIIVTNNFIHN